MLNITLLSLACLSYTSHSPFYSINRLNHMKTSTYFQKSLFSRFFSTVIYSNSNNHNTIIRNTVFDHISRSAVVFIDGDYSDTCYFDNQNLFTKPDSNRLVFKNIQTSYDKYNSGWIVRRPFFFSDPNRNNAGCGDITIAGCTFSECYSTGNDHNGGGGILIEQDCKVIIHETIFNACHTDHLVGGAAYICKVRGTHDKNGGTFKDQQTKEADIQYCCFQHCYGNKDDIYGVAMLVSAQVTILLYSSTTNCTTDVRAYGAQFDIQADNITSLNTNTTGSYSTYCGAIEYRDATKGKFMYQTMTKNDCKYATSFTSLTIDGMEISSCNYVNNTIRYNYGGISDALVHIRNKPITLEFFYFIDTIYPDNDKGQFVSCDKSYSVTMKFCYANDPDPKRRESFFETENCNWSVTDYATFDIKQLNLGDCQGEQPPAPIIITSIFTPSADFTISQAFTNSFAFSVSQHFTNSEPFNTTDKFSKSEEFTNSQKFSLTDSFSKSDKFSYSKSFSKSNAFSGSDQFSNTKAFTKSDHFSKTSKFSDSIVFTKSDHFSESTKFTKSNQFSNSQKFTNSNYFSHSEKFTKSSEFSKTDIFSETKKFTKSLIFSESNDFSRSKMFSRSSFFSESNKFSRSDAFSKSQMFSESDGFTKSVAFSSSNAFKATEVFTHSDYFSK